MLGSNAFSTFLTRELTTGRENRLIKIEIINSVQ